MRPWHPLTTKILLVAYSKRSFQVTKTITLIKQLQRLVNNLSGVVVESSIHFLTNQRFLTWGESDGHSMFLHSAHLVESYPHVTNEITTRQILTGRCANLVQRVGE